MSTRRSGNYKLSTHQPVINTLWESRYLPADFWYCHSTYRPVNPSIHQPIYLSTSLPNNTVFIISNHDYYMSNNLLANLLSSSLSKIHAILMVINGVENPPIFSWFLDFIPRMIIRLQPMLSQGLYLRISYINIFKKIN